MKIVNCKNIHKAKVDIYAPCAMGSEFNRNTIKELNCKIIAGGANNQFTNEKGMTEVAKRGIWYIPDYVVNAGGLVQIVDELHKGGYNGKRVRRNIDKIGKSVGWLITESQKTGFLPFQIAEKIVHEKIYKHGE